VVPDPAGEQPLDTPLDTNAWFGRCAPVVLEIGSGSGTSTLAMAQDEPDIDVIAVEIYRRGLAQLLCAIDREQVGNIRLIRGNGIDVLERLIAPSSLTGVRVFFPDPWPKARHHKRRFLQPATVDLIADRLLPGGVLHAATDHPGYAEHIAFVGDAESRLVRVGPGTESLPMSVVRPTTKYETKAQKAGSAVTELIWKRR
jgi:tRNA (guanine-N7-)-methyltransferase